MALQELSVRDVVVDKCFHCHGLFLDEGELEKLSAHEGMWGQLRTFFAKKGRE
jgi:Zn-finger nucleic acid-binding protein